MNATEKSVIVTGADGQLGSELCRQLGSRALGLTRNDCDLSDPAQTQRMLNEYRPQIVINSAAYTAVDRAEAEIALCHSINADAVLVLANACRNVDATLVQVSTDYVFGGDQERSLPYCEEDEPSPLSVYGRSKLAGEQYAAEAGKYFVVRTCGLYGRRVKPTQSNFVDTMLRLSGERDLLRVVADQHCTPSYCAHVAKAILQLMETNVFGLYHLVNAGATTWYELATEIFRIAGIDVCVEPIASDEYKTVAKRPNYSVLCTNKLSALGIRLPTWKEALKEYLQTCDLNRS